MQDDIYPLIRKVDISYIWELYTCISIQKILWDQFSQSFNYSSNGTQFMQDRHVGSDLQKEYGLKIEIVLKFLISNFKSNHVTKLAQLSCRGMCKVVTWSGHYFCLYKSKMILYNILIMGSEAVCEMTYCNVWCSCQNITWPLSVSICIMKNDIVETTLSILYTKYVTMMTSSNGNIFHVTGPLCGELPGPGDFPHKGQWRGALMFTLICVWINGCVNNREAGDLRRYCAHYGVTVMTTVWLLIYSIINVFGMLHPVAM